MFCFGNACACTLVNGFRFADLVYMCVCIGRVLRDRPIVMSSAVGRFEPVRCDLSGPFAAPKRRVALSDSKSMQTGRRAATAW